MYFILLEQKFGWSSLHFAAERGNAKIVELLIRPVHDTDIKLKAHVSKYLFVDL